MTTKQKRLAKARKQRHQASHALKQLSTGDVALVDILRDTPKCLLSVRIFTVMNNAPRLGEAGVKKCLQMARVWPTDRMGTLSDEQIEEIINHLPPRALR